MTPALHYTAVFAGIDPGFSGAIALLSIEGKVVAAHDMPVLKVGKKNVLNEGQIKRILSSYPLQHVFIEKAGVMPKQGAVSGSRYVGSYEFVRGLCLGLGIPCTPVTPQAWKKKMMAGTAKEKEASIWVVNQIHPHLELTRKKDHGKADACLIAEYGRREFAKKGV